MRHHPGSGESKVAMQCLKCNTWNPDDKVVCWRCQAELPRPVEEKKKREARAFLGLPPWAWVVLVALMLFWLISGILPNLLGH
jgi:uncharacterized paraquat-inducible protein A